MILNSDTVIKTASSSSYGVREPVKELGKEDFLYLMVTQLKNQDPLNPLDNNEFISQTTQFSSLEQLINISEGLTSMSQNMSDGNYSAQLFSASNFIGKEVKYFSDKINLTEEGALIGYELNAVPSDISIQIKNASGAVVAEIIPGDFGYGLNELNWDGTTSDGTALSDGVYSITVNAKDANGSALPARTYTKGVADGMTMLGGKLQFDIGGVKADAGSIFSVYEKDNI